MGKKFISVLCRKTINRLHEKDIKKIYYAKIKNLPAIPVFESEFLQKQD